MDVKLFTYQEDAIEKLKTGSILCGGVGSGKSLTALAYYYTKVCDGKIGSMMKSPKDLYIITTARKRDTREWDDECFKFCLVRDLDPEYSQAELNIDSWNNIGKYTEINNAFFIFDEQRVIGSGEWVKAFLKIAKNNDWILLSATPGDTWMDYIPVFLANGFYKNRSEFIKKHVVYSPYTKFPKVQKYLEVAKLVDLRNSILVEMDMTRSTVAHHKKVFAPFDKKLYDKVISDRWNIYTSEPVKDIAELCRVLRTIVNSDTGRIELVKSILSETPRTIIFYNFNYELSALRQLATDMGIKCCEWNGHKHDPLPDGDKWVYLVQYNAGAEGWNCIKTNTIIFYSQNYSYKIMHQAAGRIDRLNTPYSNLYYYHILSKSSIDSAIDKALSQKKTFNEKKFLK